MLVPVVRLLADPVEKCREGALTFLNSAAEQLLEPAGLLSCLMPAVADRMGDVPVAEPSEELRLAIIRLIAGPIIMRSQKGLIPYLTMIVKVVCRALEDPFHDIKKVSHSDLGVILSDVLTFKPMHTCCLPVQIPAHMSPMLHLKSSLIMHTYIAVSPCLLCRRVAVPLLICASKFLPMLCGLSMILCWLVYCPILATSTRAFASLRWQL